MPDAPKPLWRRPWVWALSLALAGLIAVPLGLFHTRRQGIRRLDAVLADHKARGLGSSPVDLLVGLPKVDRDLSAELGATMATLLGSGKLNTMFPDDRADWVLGRVDTPPARFMEQHARFAETTPACIDLLNSGRLGIGPIHSLQRMFPTGRFPSLQVARLPMPNLMSGKALCNALRLHALLADDPVPALKALDSQVLAYEPPEFLITGLIGISVRSGRDEGYLDCAILGNLPEDAAQAWLDDKRDELDVVADAMRGERLLFAGTFARDIRNGNLPVGALAAGGTPGVEEARSGFHMWLHGARDMAVVLEWEGRVEQALRDREPIPSIKETHEFEGLAQILTPNFPSVCGSALDARARARLKRLAARVVFLHREKGALPADEAELRTWMGEKATLLDGKDVERQLLYRRVAEDRFQLVADPAAKKHPLWESVRPGGETLDPEKPLKQLYRVLRDGIDVRVRTKPAGK